MLYSGRKQFDRAERLIRLNSLDNIYDYNSDFELGDILIRQARHDEAEFILTRLKKITEIRPNNSFYKNIATRASQKLAENEYARFRFENAINHLNQIDFHPGGYSFFTSNELLARIYRYKEDHHSAFEVYKTIVGMDYKQILQIYPGYFESAKNVLDAFCAEDFLASEHGLKGEYYGSLALARYYTSQMQLEKATRFAEILNPVSSEYHDVLATIYSCQGKYEASRREAYRAWTFDKSNTRLIGKGVLALIQENRKFSRYLSRILIQLPQTRNNSVVYRKLLMTHSDIGKVLDSYSYSDAVAGLRQSLPDKLLTSITKPEIGNCSLLVLPMWGIGDEIMIAGVYHDLQKYAISRNVNLTIGVENRLFTLMQRSFPKITFREISRKHRGPHVNRLNADESEQGSVLPNNKLYYTLDRDTWMNMDNFDHIIPAPLAARDFRKSRPDFKGEGKYLIANYKLKNEFQDRLDRNSPKPKIGISWRSSFNQHDRSVYYTALEQWGPVFRHKDSVDFVNLQYDKCDNELQAAKDLFDVDIINIPDLDLFNDFESVSALIACLDATIAPCTVMAELAGALGMPTLYMVNALEGNWRFKDEHMGDVWFDSITFIRPDQYGDKKSLIEKTANELQKIIGNLQKTQNQAPARQPATAQPMTTS